MQLQSLFLALTAVATTQAGVIERQNACSSYTIIDTRGTGEAQGPSAGFRTMNSNIQSQLPGGKVYNTVYAADASQNSAAGTADIVRKVQSTLSSNPNECFILEGYSQGAAATTNALPKLTGASFDAVKGVFLIGNPEHRAGLACNVDTNGGTTTKNVNGLSYTLGRIPDNWVSKTLDVCNYVSRRFLASQNLAERFPDIDITGRRRLRHHPRLWHQCPTPRIPGEFQHAEPRHQLCSKAVEAGLEGHSYAKDMKEGALKSRPYAMPGGHITTHSHHSITSNESDTLYEQYSKKQVE